jgi:hypothetical protein
MAQMKVCDGTHVSGDKYVPAYATVIYTDDTGYAHGKDFCRDCFGEVLSGFQTGSMRSGHLYQLQLVSFTS